MLALKKSHVIHAKTPMCYVIHKKKTHVIHKKNPHVIHKNLHIIHKKTPLTGGTPPGEFIPGIASQGGCEDVWE